MIINQLTSSSAGNSTIISNDETTIMIDAGIALKKVVELAGSDLKLDAVFVTHEHKISCAPEEESSGKLLSKNENSKYCSKCKDLKELTLFRNRSDKPHLKHSWCRQCESTARKLFLSTLEGKKWKTDYEKSENRKIVVKKYKEKYHETIIKKRIKYSLTESFKNSQRRRQLKEDYKLKQAANSHTRRTAVRNLDSKLTYKTLLHLKEINIILYGCITCEYCHLPISKYHIEHVQPICKGGDNSLCNLKISCKNCNLSKGRKSLQEFEQHMKIRAEVNKELKTRAED